MKILIISGFLGAGKTTFIKEMAKTTKKEFAVLENEYGAAGLDGDILNNSITNGDVNVWEMTEGCICCSAKGDFAASVLTIANTIDPEYLVIEPTGVGMLSNIVANLQQIEYERISLLAPITVVDGYSFDRYINEYTQLYKDQISNAKTIIISKMEQADDQEKSRLKVKLEEINNKSNICVEHYSKFSLKDWDNILGMKFDGSIIDEGQSNGEKLPDSFSISNIVINSPEKLIIFLEDLIHGAYGNVFRAKGVVKAMGNLFRFDVADNKYSIIGENGNYEAKATFIGEGIERQKIRRIFIKKIAVNRR